MMVFLSRWRNAVISLIVSIVGVSPTELIGQSIADRSLLDKTINQTNSLLKPPTGWHRSAASAAFIIEPDNKDLVGISVEQTVQLQDPAIGAEALLARLRKLYTIGQCEPTSNAVTYAVVYCEFQNNDGQYNFWARTSDHATDVFCFYGKNKTLLARHLSESQKFHAEWIALLNRTSNEQKALASLLSQEQYQREKRAAEQRADDKRADDKRADDKRADDKRADDDREEYYRQEYYRKANIKADQRKADQRAADLKADQRKADQRAADQRAADHKR